MSEADTTERDRPEQRHIWTSGRAVAAHVALAVWVPGCAVATWWQVSIALSGDSVGWIYSVMWPGFAVFGTVFWWNLVHDDPDTVGSRGLRRLQESEQGLGDAAEQGLSADEVIRQAEEDDPELAQYNAYLASLADGNRPKTWLRR